MSEWQKILEPFGALWHADELTGFQSTPIAGNSQTAIPMLNHKLIEIQGRNAETFLQGQLSCDIRRLANGDHILGAHCNAKGRMVSSMQVFREHSDRVLLRVPADMVTVATAALQKYAAFSKVAVSASDMIGLAILPSESVVPEYTGSANPSAGKVGIDTAGFFLQHADWLEFWGSEGQCHALLHEQPYRLSRTADLTDFLVRKGVAEVRPATSEEFIPQMFNFDLLDGISFKKGCYTGQEIVARLHYRGQTKKRTFLFSCQNAVIGALIVDAEQPEQPVGTVVAASTGHALACLPLELYANPQRLHLKSKSGSVLEWLNQPYAIP